MKPIRRFENSFGIPDAKLQLLMADQLIKATAMTYQRLGRPLQPLTIRTAGAGTHSNLTEIRKVGKGKMHQLALLIALGAIITIL